MSIAKPIYALRYRRDVPEFNLMHNRVIYEVFDLNTQLDESTNGVPLYTGIFSVEEFEVKRALKEIDTNAYYLKEFGAENLDRAKKIMQNWLKTMKKSKDISLTFQCG